MANFGRSKKGRKESTGRRIDTEKSHSKQIEGWPTFRPHSGPASKKGENSARPAHDGYKSGKDDTYNKSSKDDRYTSNKVDGYKPGKESAFTKVVAPVSAFKLRTGLDNAGDEIKDTINKIIDTMKTEYDVSEVELTVSFGTDGRFLGFGIGGAASIKIKVSPGKNFKNDVRTIL